MDPIYAYDLLHSQSYVAVNKGRVILAQNPEF